ncbi:MAG: methyltransferase domain-containing protein [Planctomycetes bacterium]|nr:methyltransferase domain-containing protein [Planctomycetota bacterium]
MSLRRLLSHLVPFSIERGESRVHPRLSVRLVGGRLRLDAQRVNHSGGSLRDVWAAAFAHLRPERRPLERVLLLGLGGGSSLDLLRERGVHAPIDAVELDPEVVRLARAHFGLERLQPLEIHVADALDWIERPGERYDLVLVDLFIEDEIPPAARAEPFLRGLGARLAPGGLLVFNQLGHTPRRYAEALELQRLAARVLGPARILVCGTNQLLVHEAGHATR